MIHIRETFSIQLQLVKYKIDYQFLNSTTMKKKKTKIVNSLKLGILLFGISLLLWNCEKENSEIIPQSGPSISLKKVKKQFYLSLIHI